MKHKLLTGAAVVALTAGMAQADLMFTPGEGDFSWEGYEALKSIDLSGETVTVFGAWLGEEKENLVIHSKEILKTEEFNFFIYGHRHVPKEFSINENSMKFVLTIFTLTVSFAVHVFSAFFVLVHEVRTSHRSS